MSYTPPVFTNVGGSLAPGYTPPVHTSVGGIFPTVYTDVGGSITTGYTPSSYTDAGGDVFGTTPTPPPNIPSPRSRIVYINSYLFT